MTAFKNVRKGAILPLLLAAIISCVSQAQDTEFDFTQFTMYGAGFKDTSTMTGLPLLSMAGGAPILLSGLNFATQAGWNSWRFEPTFMEGAEIWGPDMTSDDQMNSNDLNGRLGYIVPPVWDLMGVDRSLFNGDYLPSGFNGGEDRDVLGFYVSIRNNEDHWFVECSNAANCWWAYRRDYTPQLLDITPPNVAQGQEIHFHINARGAHTTTVTPADAPPYRSIHMGQYLIDLEDIVEDEDRLNNWSHDMQYAIMTDGYAQNSTDPKILFYNGLAMLMRSMTHCNFAGDDCWTVRVHPRIKSVAFNTGYTTGGQIIRLEGLSFNGTNVEVSVGGEPCALISNDTDYIVCRTAAASSASPVGYQPGQPGLTQIQTDEDYNEYLVLSSTSEVMNLNSTQPVSGWWKAPADGDYRFYLACNAACSLSMDVTTPFDASAITDVLPTTEVVASRGWNGGWRNYHYQADDGHYSNWMTLVGGQQYYFSMSGAEQMSVGFEYKDPNGATTETVTTETCVLTGTSTTCNSGDVDCDCSTTTEEVSTTLFAEHELATKAMQQIAYEHTIVLEEWSYTVNNPDDNTYVLNIVDTTTDPMSVWTSDAMRATATASQVKTAIKKFFKDVWGSDITVVRTMYDLSGQEVSTLDENTTSITYTVTVKKLLPGFSTSNIMASPVGVDDWGTTGTAATISVIPPSQGIQSSPPFNGTYTITCYDYDGFEFTSDEIQYNWWDGSIQWHMESSMGMMVENIEVKEDYRFPYKENGISFTIQFTGLDYDPPLCSIQPAGDYPLTGNVDMVANVTKVRNFADTLFFPTIPLEQLTSDAQTPQILVTIDGMPALCVDLNCDFAYIESTSMISTHLLNSDDSMVITGTALPNEVSDKIQLGPVTCSVTTHTDTQIDCQLSDTRVSGDWIVQILTNYGLLPNEILSADSIVIPIVANTISPNTDVNYLGGDLMTITGDSFGYDPSVISVTYADGTICDVQSVDMTTITCFNRRFTSGAASSQTITIAMNGVDDSSLGVNLLAQAEETIQMSPTSVSPVLKSELVITLASSYPDALVAEDFTAVLFGITDTTYERTLFVMSVDNTARTVTIKFPGAWSGQYQLQLSSVQHGRIDSDLLILDVHGTVTNVSPLSGSKYGGALVTITGENFSDNPLDNPVMIGGHYCYVITTSPTEITCRTDLLTDQISQDELVVVFLKTSEEAATPNDDDIMFTFGTPASELTDIQVTFDESSFTHKVTVTGTGFDSSIQLYIDGIEQTQDSSSSTGGVFTITDMDTTDSQNIQVFTAEGYPEGSQIVHSVDVAPALLAIEPAIGSAGGSKITVTGSGFGMQTTGLNLQANGVELCSSVEIFQYGSFYCWTNKIEVANGAQITITLDGSAMADSFVASDVAYEQSNTITVTGVTQNSNQIIFTGTGFPTADFSGQASLAGVDADTVTINSATEIVAEWFTTGVPTSTVVPELSFVHNVDNYINWAAIDTTAVTFENLHVVLSSQSGLECSFAGGCTYSIESEGLYASLLNAANEILVCGSPCTLREDLSNEVSAVCQLPKLATTYSVDNYKITAAKDLSGTIFPDGTEILHDSLTVESYETSASECEFGMTFKEGHVAVLDEAKVFIGFLTDKTPYVDQLEFHGSNDNWATFDQLHIFSEEIHEGWNYIDYRDDGVDKPAYNSYRFYGTAAGACKVTEYKLHGVEAIADENNSYSCTPKILIGGEELSASLNAVSYTAAQTPKLTAITPRYGSVLGGTTVTLTGENLQGAASTTVLFDNRECTVSSVSANEIQCLTADKPYVPDSPETIIDIEGMGYVATQNLIYRYVSLWSDTETWGGDIPPMEGESISIPSGQHLLVDVDSTPELNAIIVEGSLIFAPDADPNHMRTFDANFIMVVHGYFELGTEEFPYTSKMVITMHATRFSPSFAIYGNKMIGCRFCKLSMHGIPKTTTWTRLATTAMPGDTEITVQGEPDWNVGDHIVIAGTTWWSAYDHEERYIASISGSTITLTEALEHKHLSVAPTFGGVEMPMRAEVGLLTRNVVFRGNPADSRKDLFGAHIMIHSPGDESSVARIHYIELTEAGQAFKLGRYAIHFHMIGTVHGSLVKGNAIHHSYNRACTTHGVHYFKVEQNVAYDTMGHSFFIEDAVETKCVYDGNLSILTRASNSFLNTDQTPGGFWITNPDNILINNAIVGSDAYSYWYDMQTTGIGANFDPNICPERTKLGEFRNNTAHSSRKYGLRIFHALVPHEKPCSASPYDPDYEANGHTDPYWQNPKVPAIFEDFVGWKMGRNGAISERTGNVIFKNFKIADSGIAGAEFSAIENLDTYGYVGMQGGMIIGNTGVNDDDGILSGRTTWGFIGPRHEYLTVDGVSFYNFDFANSAAIGTCSHCFHPAATDSGGRTLQVKNLYIDQATVPRKILYQFPHREIIHDVDGSLTGKGPDSWATFFYPHLNHTMCDHDEEQFNGIVCDSSTALRRVAFHGYQPQSLTMQKIKVASWSIDFEDLVKSNETDLHNFLQDIHHTNFSHLIQREKPDPNMGWPIVVATGHRYRVHWGEGIDFEQMHLDVSPLWTQTDHNVHFMTNFTDVRASINITDRLGVKSENETLIQKLEHELISGDNVIYNQTQVREFLWVVNGKNYTEKKTLKIEGFRCVVNCEEPVVEDCPIPPVSLPWSSVDTWDSGALPAEGEDVEIPACTWIEFDIEETPIFKSVTVNGRLSFKNDLELPANRTIHTHTMYVRAGELVIGSESQPYMGNATIKLHGEVSSEAIAPSMLTEFGNKGLFIVGLADLHGKPRDRMTRLKQTAFAGESTVYVEAGLDWAQYDRVALAPTAMQNHHVDYMTVESYDVISGAMTFYEPLKYYHWGHRESTGLDYSGVDMRCEVILLSRNVRVVGDDSHSWGGQILVSDNFEINGQKQRSGQLFMDNVEVYNCSQRNTFKSAIRFEAALLKWSYVRNSVVHGSIAWGLSAQYSRNILVEHSSFIGARAVGVNVITSRNVTLNGIIVGDVRKRPEMEMHKMVDKESCVSICAYFGEDGNCQGNTITNSLAFGCVYAGFVAPGHDCDDHLSQQKFRNNIAHSVDGSGAYIFPDATGNSHHTCYEGSHFAAYKVQQTSVGTHFITDEVRMINITSIDTQLGVNLQISGETDKKLAILKDSKIYGETKAEDCPDNHPCHCTMKSSIMLFSMNHGSKKFHIDTASPLPMHKVKSYGTWKGDTLYDNCDFINFSSNKTMCGAPQKIFAVNPYDSDFIPVQTFQYTTFNNVHDDAMAFLMDPPEKWNNLDDCIGFPCTAPSNIVMHFTRSSYDGTVRPFWRDLDFQIVSDTYGASDAFNNCQMKEEWNAWFCTNDNLGQLMFIADDTDWEDRNVAPVWITNEATGYTNKINHQMDHMWDGFYTGQKHKSQFQAMVETNQNYTIEYTSTPFKYMRYELRANTGSMKIKVHYWNAGSYKVKANGEYVDYTAWDKDLGAQSELTGYKGCGENRYVGVHNYLEFMITPNCLIEIEPFDAIMSMVRMQWTLDEFYASGGVVSFVDRVSASLGIHASQMKVVAVYQGSVVVDYEVTAAEEDENKEAAKRALRKQILQLVKDDDTVTFGAPILSAETDTIIIKDDPNYNPAINPALNPATGSPIGVDETEEQAQTVTMKDEDEAEEVMNAAETAVATTGLAVVIGVLGVAVACCFGCGILLICSYQITKNGKQVSEIQKKHMESKEAKKRGQMEASESNMSVEHQHDATEHMDIDMFTNKKRKQIIKDEVAEVYASRDSQMSQIDNSAQKVLQTDQSLIGADAPLDKKKSEQHVFVSAKVKQNKQGVFDKI